LLKTFFERLRDLCADDSESNGEERSGRIRAQAKQAYALAAELGILKSADITWSDFQDQIGDAKTGSEHVVELDEKSNLVGKTTKPPAFGLIPALKKLPKFFAWGGVSSYEKKIEFFSATPLEYLARWIANNDIFGDDVRLVSVIRWKDGLVSFGITQPQYHGRLAEPREIETYFLNAGWTRLFDPSGHLIYFNYAFEMMAIDAAGRNCFINDSGFQPFDVILYKPDECLERFLKIYQDRLAK